MTNSSAAPGALLRIAPLFLALFITTAELSTAQDRLDPVAMGMGRSATAFSRGLGALLTNPGGLGYFPLGRSAQAHDLVFSVYSGGGSIGGTYLAGDEFSQIFGEGAGQTDEARERIGELLVDERLFANGGINFLTGIWRIPDGGGTLGLHYGSRAYARVNFPDDLATLIATSNIADKNFRFVNRGIGATWFTEFGLSYGRVFGDQSSTGWLPSFGLGLSGRLIGGVVHFDVTENSALYIDQINVNGQLQFLVRGGYTFRSSEPDAFDQEGAVGNFLSNPFPSTAGFGIATDVGVNGILYRGDRRSVHYGMVFANLGRISWTNKARERRGEAFSDTLGAALGKEEFEKFEGDLVTVGDYSTTLPSTFRAGLGLSIHPEGTGEPANLMIGLEGELPLNQVPGNTPDPRLSAGVDWGASKVVSLRGGISVGGISDVGVALGLGVRPTDWMSIDVGSSELNALFSGDRLDFAGRISFGFTPGQTTE